MHALARRVTARVTARATRGLSSKVPAEQGHIADVDGLTGRMRQEAVYKRVYGEELFDREASIYLEEGSRENPIPILSVEAERHVGVSLPDDAEVRWMILRKGELAYDPDTANYFALKQVSQAEVDEWVKKAEGALPAHLH